MILQGGVWIKALFIIKIIIRILGAQQLLFASHPVGKYKEFIEKIIIVVDLFIIH